jgi:hypothetical protein
MLRVAMHVEREIKSRDAARTIPTHAALLRYDLDRQWTYPSGPLLDARKQDILQAVKFSREAEQWLPDHLKNKAALDALVKRVQLYLDQKEPSEPYRQVLEQVLHRIEAVRQGEIIVKPHVAAKPPATVAAPGSRVSDFVVVDQTCQHPVRLYELLGRPVLLIFYNPTTEMGGRVMEFARKVGTDYQNRLNILALTTSGKTAAAVKQHKDLELAFPVADGTSLFQTFAVEDTPRMVLIDGSGVVRGMYTGWGFLVTEQILGDLQKCCAAKKMPNP